MQFTLRALAVAVALVVMFGCSVDLSKHLPEPVTLNADDYRSETSDIDRLLFSPKPYDNARRTQSWLPRWKAWPRASRAGPNRAS